jgi:hypothetical protein
MYIYNYLFNQCLSPLMYIYMFCFCLMVFNATFSNVSVISLRSVLLVEGTGVPGENLRLAARHWKTYDMMLYTLPWSRFELRTSMVIGTNCIGSWKSNYQNIMDPSVYVCIVLFNLRYLQRSIRCKLLIYTKPFHNNSIRDEFIARLIELRSFPRHQRLSDSCLHNGL